MKRMLCLLCAVLIAVSCLPPVPITAFAADIVDSGTCGDNLTWTLDSEGTLTISGTGPMTNYSWGGAPWISVREDINSVLISNGVTTIGNLAFQHCPNLANVTIPDSVTTIGEYVVFACANLTEITIPSGVISIDKFSFVACSNLVGIWVDKANTVYCSDNYGVLYSKDGTQLIKAPEGISGTYTITDNVTTISDFAFMYCRKLTGVIIGDKVDKIGIEAFCECINLTDVIIGDSVTAIGSSAFSSCDSLRTVALPASVVSIERSAFYCCTNLNGIWVDGNNNVYSSDSYGVLFDKAKDILIQAPGGIDGYYVVPDSVTEIGCHAFAYCGSLSAVKIPGSVNIIGDEAFRHCDKLLEASIPDSVVDIGGAIFWGCENLVSITMGGGITAIPNSMFDGCHSLGSVSIPNGVSVIEKEAFWGCGLRSVIIPDSVTTINDEAFYLCHNLTDVYYSGSETQWKAVSIGVNNDSLLNATVHYAYDPAAEATAGTNCCMSLEEALSEAQAGDTVKLLQDAQMDEIILTDGVIIDLNGHVLTVDALTAYAENVANGYVVDSSAGNSGLLAVEKDTAVFCSDNPDMPLYDAENGGYRFFDNKLELLSSTTNAGEGKEKFWFKFHFYTDDTCAELDSDAYAIVLAGNSGMEVGTSLTWKGKALSPVRFVKNGSADAFSQAWAKGATQARWFYITVKGLDEVEDGVLTVTPQISANGVTAENGKITYVKGDVKPGTDYGWSEGGPTV